jgi:hypothetical protein
MTPEQELPTPEDILAEAIAEATDHRNAAKALAEADYDKAVGVAEADYRAELAAAGDAFSAANEMAAQEYSRARLHAISAYHEATGQPVTLEVPK